MNISSILAYPYHPMPASQATPIEATLEAAADATIKLPPPLATLRPLNKVV